MQSAHHVRDRAKRVLGQVRWSVLLALDEVDVHELVGRLRLNQRYQHLLRKWRDEMAIETEDHRVKAK
jgi:hypothetical protein